jgi:hypothetical protein
MGNENCNGAFVFRNHVLSILSSYCMDASTPKPLLRLNRVAQEKWIHY